jgi:epoxyqueuosine reductase QueG
MADEGLEAYAIVDGERLQGYFSALEPALAGRYAADGVSGAVVAALPYDPRPATPRDPIPGSSPMLDVGAFAAENRYATLARLLGNTARRLASATALPRKAFRVAVNSRLPEKRLAALAGLGWIGRSTILVSYAYGPACVLGVLLLPASFPMAAIGDGSGPLDGLCDPSASTPGGLCGGCRACVDACPTRAIRDGMEGSRGIDLGLCIQYWASNRGEVPPAVRLVWGRRLYGCDECVAACPYSTAAWTTGVDGTSPAGRAASLAAIGERRPGPRVPTDLVRLAPDDGLRAFFKRTALGLSWLPPDLLRRNASLACGMPALPFDGGPVPD